MRQPPPGSAGQPAFELSVILAEAKDNPEVGPPLRAIERACAGISTEVLVVRPPGRPALPPSGTVTLREVIADEQTLVPKRWGLGAQAACAPVFACLTTELTVDPEWGRALLDALGTGAVGAAGAIRPAPRAGMVSAAVYLVRFSGFLPQSADGFREADQIPGDSAAYRREAVLAYPDLLAEGFWEAEFHRRFHEQGKQLALSRRPLSTFRTSLGLRSAMALRARHGFGYGESMVSRHRHSSVRLLAGAPAVPFVLVARILRRSTRSRGALGLALRAFPALALVCAAWAWGEGTGAWAARSRR